MTLNNFKYIPYRNPKILALAKDQACQHCGRNDGSTVAAHSNLGADGKGVGKKSDDMFVSYLCADCHYNYDNKTTLNKGFLLPQQFRLSQQDFDQAMKKTMKIWVSQLLPMREQ